MGKDIQDVAGRLTRWATEQPEQLALVHKRQGVWKAWRWVDVQRDVAHLQGALRSLGPARSLGVQGALAPELILLALAAQAEGLNLVCLDPHVQGDALRAGIRARQLDLLLVTGQAGAQQAVRALEGQTDGPRLILSHLQPGSATSAVALARLYPGGVPESRPPLGWQAVQRARLGWVEEGSEWPDGLRLVLDRLLSRGEGVAFPETAGSAERDRRDIAPVALLLSPARAQALAGALEARLAPVGSLRRRLWLWAQRHTGRPGLHRALRLRVRALAGLHRVRVVEPLPGTGGIWWQAVQEGA